MRIVIGGIFCLCLPLAMISAAAAHEAPHEVLDPLPPSTRLQTASGDGLFRTTTDSTAAPAPDASGFVKRSRVVQFDASYRDRMLMAPEVGKVAAGRMTGQDPVPAQVTVFKLPLFDDVVVSLYKTGMSTDNLGNTVWTGRVLGSEAGEATLVFGHDQISGSVRVGSRSFTVASQADGSTRVIELSANKRPHVNPLRRPGRAAAPAADAVNGGAAVPVISAATGAATTVSLLIAYTPRALADDPNIATSISLAVAYTNNVFANSGMNVRVNLLGTMEANYTETLGESSSTILTDLQAGAGGFAAVHTRRDALGADLVSVWSHFSDACGVSYILDDADTTPTVYEAPYGYNIISTSFGNGCLTDAVAHELGHNMGARHDRYEDDPNDLLTSVFNFGYVDVAHRFMTIMSYPNECDDAGETCAIIPYHSSPNLTYQGAALGIADASPNSADNVKEINAIAPYIALFRTGAAASTPLVSAALPSSRSVQINHTATFFMTVINSGTVAATNCRLTGLARTDGGVMPAYAWTWQTTSSQTNQVTGTAETAVSIPAGGSQSFVVGASLSSPVASTFGVVTTCDNATSPTVIPGVNTLQLTVDANPVPDVIALALTPSDNGILAVPTGTSGAFAVATADIGTAGSIVVSADTGSAVLPASLTLCQTDSSTGQCLAPPASTLTHAFAAGETPTFSIFATATGAISFDPANARIFVRFKDAAGGTVRGATSVALQSP
ncbi:reprolysin-like metallopeptidase [Aliidongia sp.]|uniref:reprolysin-like metallopeptidase n=1 Tax=Aliidongia sp. TaxID=1914230 RepID=UPI002DDD7E90|nr:M12 family metallo-peptidase [Aliidongia sp.]